MSDVWRICVVEGDVSLNQNLVNSLREDGYVVQGVMNSVDAMRILGSEEYKVVICDQNLSDGLELLRWLRSYRSDVRLIVLGNASETGESDQCLQALASGATSYIQKPVDLRLLKDELHRLLRQAGFTVSLNSFDLLDVIQIVTMGGKSITLLIDTGPGECGTLRFQNGELAWAEYGVLRGEEAFFALATHKNGTVTQQFSDEPFVPNVTQPLSRLIFQALQYRTKYANKQQPLEQGLVETGFVPVVGTGLAPVQPPENASPPAQFLPDDIDDSPFAFTSEGMVSNDSGSIQQMPPVAAAEPAISVPQEPLEETTQVDFPVIEQLNFSQSDQRSYPPSPSTQDNAANPYGNKILLGLIIATVVSLLLMGLGGNNASTDRPSFIANAGISLFVGVMVSILLIDWKGFVSLRGWIKWQHMEKKKKISLEYLFFSLFPVMFCIYLARVCLASFQSKSSLSSYTTKIVIQNKRVNIGITIGSLITLIFLAFATGTDAIGTRTVTERPTPTAIAQAYQKNTITPIPSSTPMATPTPVPTPTSTLVPQLQPTQPPKPPVGVNGNPWGYDFNPGNLIYSPPQNFCDYFNCVRSFWENTDGYVDECKDGTYSRSGGLPGACFKHGGEMRPLYSH